MPATWRLWPRPRWTRLLGIVLGLGVVGALTWAVTAGGFVRTVYRDGATLSFEDGTVRVRSIVWGPPKPIDADPGTQPSGAAGSVLVVALPTQRGDHDLYLRQWLPGGWSAPVPIPGGEGTVNTDAEELTPLLTPSGEILVFASDRPGGMGGLDLWMARRTAGGWEDVQHLGRQVNSPFNEHWPALAGGDVSGEPLLLVFATDQPVGFLRSPPAEWLDVLLDGQRAMDENLALAIGHWREGGDVEWTPPRPLEEVNTPAAETAPAFAPTGRFLYFASDRRGGAGDLDLYRARRDRPELSGSLLLAPPRNLGPPVNSPGDDTAPQLLGGGYEMAYLQTPRGASEGNVVLSQCVEVEKHLELGSLPLEAIAAHARDLSLLLAFALLVLSGLLVAYRTRERWAVSLTTRCAVMALCLHLVMLYAFYFWQVGRSVLAVARKEQRTELTLEGTLASRISAEIRRVAPPVPDERPAMARAHLLERAAVERMAAARPLAREDLQAIRPADVSLEAARGGPDEPTTVEGPQPRDGVAPAVVVLPALPEPRPSAAEADDPAPRARSLRAPTREAEMEAVAPAEIPAEVTARPDTLASLPQAVTPVLAPEPTPLLPAVGRARPEPAPRLETLPVADQSPARPQPDLAPDPGSRERTATSRPTRDPGRQRAPELHTTPLRLAAPRGTWESTPVGLEPRPAPPESAEPLPAVRVLPESRPLRVASTRLTLPENVPLAERSAPARVDAEIQRAGVAPIAYRSADPMRAPSLQSPETLSRTRPLSAADELAVAVTSAAVARLDTLPRPGDRLELPRETVAPLVRTEAPARLPESAASDPTDIAPARSGTPALERRVTERREATPLAGEETPPEILSASGSGVLRPRGSVGTSAVGDPDLVRGAPLGRRDPADRSPAEALDPLDLRAQGATPVPVARRLAGAGLPEASPEIPRTRDLREIRAGPSRQLIVERMGGTRESESAVDLALDWFARHQSLDGRWDVDGFDRFCGKCDSRGTQPSVDAAITGLVVLCYLGRNETPTTTSTHSATVRRALEWLLATQAADGNLAGEDREYTMYSHAIASLAISEAYLMSRDPRYLEPLRKATDVILRSQNQRTGGWRYLPVPPLRGDTSVTGWQVMALKSAAAAGIAVPERTFDRARHWLDREVGGGLRGGIYGYRRVSEPRVAMTAEGLFARQLLGGRRGEANIEEAARYIQAETRGGEHLDNLYLVYYGTMALYQYQGWIWEDWNRRVRDFLVREQARTGEVAGSWDPRGPWLEEGGRVLSTAFATLTLEVYYRYLPIYWAPGDREGEDN